MKPVPGLVKARTASAVVALLLLSIIPAAAQSLSPQAGEIEVEGQVTAIDRAAHHLTLSVTSITQPGHAALDLPAARPKPILISGETSFAGGSGLEQIQVGSSLQVVGKDLGPGKELPARAILLTSAGAGELDIQGPGNLARLAKVTASKCELNTTPDGLTDGIIGGFPKDRANEWSSGQREGASVTLAWDTPQTIDTVALYNRVNGADAVTSGEMTLEDGGKVVFGKLPEDPKTPLLVRFLPRPVRTLTITITGVRAGTYSAGFSEVAVFHTGKVDSSTPNLSPVARQLTLQERLDALAKEDREHPWNETVRWSLIDPITIQIAPNRFDWNRFCSGVLRRPFTGSEPLTPQEANRVMDSLALHIKSLIARSGAQLTEMETAVVVCAFVPLQNANGENRLISSSFDKDIDLIPSAVQTLRTCGLFCGYSAAMTADLLRRTGAKAETVHVIHKGDHIGHKLVKFYETNKDGHEFSHLFDPVNSFGTDIGNGITAWRPVHNFTFQFSGSNLDRVRFLRMCSHILGKEAQGFRTPFSQDDLSSPEVQEFTESGLTPMVVDAKLPRVVVPVHTIVKYRAVEGTDFPTGKYPVVFMEVLGVDKKWHSIRQSTNHLGPSTRRGAILEMSCSMETMGFGPGYYRANFYLANGSSFEEIGRHRELVGQQEIAYGVPAN